MEFKDFIRIELKDGDGNPIPNEKYKIYLPDGSVGKKVHWMIREQH